MFAYFLVAMWRREVCKFPGPAKTILKQEKGYLTYDQRIGEANSIQYIHKTSTKA